MKRPHPVIIKFSLLAGLLCITLTVLAQQNFGYKTTLQVVDSSRFYTIDLQPALTAKCQPGLADIRLTDERGKPVPYLLGNSLPVKTEKNFRVLPEVTGSVVPKDSLLAYIAENRAATSIDRLWLKLRNTTVNRTVDLLGSDDLQHWFAIKEHIPLQHSVESTAGTFEDLLFFPASNYRYFKIQVNGRHLAPVHIMQAGIYTESQAAYSYEPVPLTKFAIATRADTTFITLTFADAYAVDKLLLHFDGAKYYKRRLQAYRIDGKRKEWLKDTLISSASNGEIFLSAKANQIQLLIFNGDNAPLNLKAINAYQLKRSVVAYLEKQHQYHLLFGNAKAVAPQYDLQFFADSIGGTLPTVDHNAIRVIPRPQQKAASGGVPAWLLWVAGGVALLLLLALTLKMTKEVSKK